MVSTSDQYIINSGRHTIDIPKTQQWHKDTTKTPQNTPKTHKYIYKNEIPVGSWCQNDVVLTSMRRNHVASTLIRRHFRTKCPLGCYCYSIYYDYFWQISLRQFVEVRGGHIQRHMETHKDSTKTHKNAQKKSNIRPVEWLLKEFCFNHFWQANSLCLPTTCNKCNTNISLPKWCKKITHISQHDYDVICCYGNILKFQFKTWIWKLIQWYITWSILYKIY